MIATVLRFLHRPVVLPPAAPAIGEALRIAYPEEQEADAAMQRAIDKLSELEESPTLVGISTTYDRA